MLVRRQLLHAQQGCWNGHPGGRGRGEGVDAESVQNDNMQLRRISSRRTLFRTLRSPMVAVV